MNLETRTTKEFIEIKVDEIETTIFKDSKQEIELTIHNLLSVVDELASYGKKSIDDYIKEGGY